MVAEQRQADAGMLGDLGPRGLALTALEEIHDAETSRFAERLEYRRALVEGPGRSGFGHRAKRNLTTALVK